MSEKKTPEHETIRLLFELDRADDPQLYDDLIRFKKGTKRINRLRLQVTRQTTLVIAGSARAIGRCCCYSMAAACA